MILRGGARAEKRAFFWSKLSKKCLKTPFLPVFFLKKFACGSENFSLNRVLILFWESSENQIDQPKRKKSAKLLKFFGKFFFVNEPAVGMSCFARDVSLFNLSYDVEFFDADFENDVSNSPESCCLIKCPAENHLLRKFFE